jgi:hypothetical protein
MHPHHFQISCAYGQTPQVKKGEMCLCSLSFLHTQKQAFHHLKKRGGESMRGKLRDKRGANKKYGFNREGLERRQPYKRVPQTMNWLKQDIEDEEYDVDMDADGVEDEVEVKQVKLPNKKL